MAGSPVPDAFRFQQPQLTNSLAEKEIGQPRAVKTFINYGFLSVNIPPVHEGQQNIKEDQFCSLTQSGCSRDPYQAVRAVGDPL